MKEDNFTPGQVGAIIEDLKAQFQAVVEIVAPLPERISGLEERFEKVEFRLTCVEDALRIGFRETLPSLTKRVERLETKAGF